MTAGLPTTVVGGFLGAGKTTLINHLLRHAEGRRLTVLVNDFGAIPIDADLIEGQEDGVLTLTNGCACCSMGGDLAGALDAVLKRSPRPDHLIIEASGVADPDRIADIARAEPELMLAAIAVVVDAGQVLTQAADRYVGDDVVRQISVADRLILNKCDQTTALDLMKVWTSRLAPNADIKIARHGAVATDWLLAPALRSHELTQARPNPHARFAGWSRDTEAAYDIAPLIQALKTAPAEMLRLKGVVQGSDDQAWLFQTVGRRIALTPAPQAIAQVAPGRTRVVALGVQDRFRPEVLDRLFDRLAVAPAERAHS